MTSRTVQPSSSSQSATPAAFDARRSLNVPTLFRVAALALALFMLLRTLSRADLGAVRALIADSGAAISIGLLPFAVTMAIDALTQRTLLAKLGQSPRYRALYLVRFVTEALSTSLPAGVLFAESAGPVLLQRHAGVPMGASIVANATKRWLTWRAHSLYVGLSVILGYATLTRISPATGSRYGLVILVGAMAFVLFLVSAGFGAVLSGRSWPQRLVQRLSALPIARFRAWLAKSHESVAMLDNRFARLTSEKLSLALSTGLLLALWLVESIETWLLLHLLGARLDFREVIAFEAGLSVARSAVFFVPAGLGVQDLGYIAFLGALGLPDAATLGAAFVALKRSKEAIWVVFGWVVAGVLSLSRGRSAARALPLSEEALS